MYKVVEHFVSINGEGKKAGELALFIRLNGCNLSCSYCDTLWANDVHAPFEWLSASDIVTLIQESGVNNVTLTGGEPLIHPKVDHLIQTILEETKVNLEIETNGSINIGPFKKPHERLSFTLDYKSPSSLMSEAMNMANYDLLDERDTVKFVVGTREDLDRARMIIEKFTLEGKTALYLSPVFGHIEGKDIVAYMCQYHMKHVKLQLQLHKYIWDPLEKGV